MELAGRSGSPNSISCPCLQRPPQIPMPIRQQNIRPNPATNSLIHEKHSKRHPTGKHTIRKRNHQNLTHPGQQLLPHNRGCLSQYGLPAESRPTQKQNIKLTARGSYPAIEVTGRNPKGHPENQSQRLTDPLKSSQVRFPIELEHKFDQQPAVE